MDSMALGEFTKQIAQQALLSATTKEPAPPPTPAQPQAENLAAVLLGQVNAMQKALKDDEELVITFQNGAERIRVMEIFTPARQMVVLSGTDAERNRARVICAMDALQLVCKVVKVPPGAQPARVALVTPKPKDSNG
jgi:hypothetical protein